MSSDENKKDTPTRGDISYKPGTFRYHEVATSKRRAFFDERQLELNPCLKESELSNSCLLTWPENQEKCSAEIENYKTCKKFWNAVRLFATANHLLRNDGFPPVEERAIWKKQLRSWIETNKLQVPEELKPLV